MRTPDTNSKPQNAVCTCHRKYCITIIPQTYSVGLAGVQNVLMCYNTELRSLYDRYAANAVLCFHSGGYIRDIKARPSNGLLSLQVWQLIYDASLASSEVPLTAVDQAMAEACKPPAPVTVRRARVSQTPNSSRVLIFEVPQHSPFRVGFQLLL